MCVVGALEYQRPFFALYKFMMLHPRGLVRKVPPYVSFMLSCLSPQVACCRHSPSPRNSFTLLHREWTHKPAVRVQELAAGCLPLRSKDIQSPTKTHPADNAPALPDKRTYHSMPTLCSWETTSASTTPSGYSLAARYETPSLRHLALN